MTYSIEVTPAAVRALRRVDQLQQRRIRATIDALGTDPRPSGARALQGHRGLLRVRVGDYRIVYEVRDAQLVVIVITLGHRREVYDRL